VGNRRLFGIIILGMFAFAGCRPAAAPVSIGVKPVSVNDVPSADAAGVPRKPVPEMSWTGFDGNISKLKDLRGKVVVLDFWATYCPPCIEEIPHLMELQARYGEDNLRVIGLHVGDDEDRAKIPEFVSRLKISYPLAYPEDDLTSYIFGRQDAIPQTAVFDGKGNLVLKITGFNSGIKQQLDAAVAAAVSQNG
jgi:thiol-disulfide isomerase/thioredoxin